MANAGPVKSEEQRIVDSLLNEDPVGTAVLKYLANDKIDITKLDLHTRSGQYGASVISRIIELFNKSLNETAIQLLLKLADLPNIDWNDQYPGGTPFTTLASLALSFSRADSKIDLSISQQGYVALLKLLQNHGEKINLNALNPFGTTGFYQLACMLNTGTFEPLIIVSKSPTFKNLNFIIKSSPCDLNIMQIIFRTCSHNYESVIKLLQYIPTGDATLWNDGMTDGNDNGMTTLFNLVNLTFITPEAWSLLKRVAMIPGLNWDAEVVAGKLKGRTPMSELLRGVATGDPRAIAIRDFIAEKNKEEMRMEWVRNYAQAGQYVPGYQGGLSAVVKEKDASMEPSAAAKP